MTEQPVTISIDGREPIAGLLSIHRDEERDWMLGIATRRAVISPPHLQVSVTEWPHPFAVTQDPAFPLPVAIYLDDRLAITGRAILIDWTGPAVIEFIGEITEHA